MRPLPLLLALTACQATDPASDTDGPPADTDVVDDTDAPGWPFGLPPVDEACRARFPSDRPDATTLARLVGTWTGFNGASGQTTLTLGADGTYHWVSDAGDYDLRDEAGTWSAVSANDRMLLVFDDVATAPAHLDGDDLIVENLDNPQWIPLRLSGGAGAGTAPTLATPQPPLAWCAATADAWRPTQPWAERPQPAALSLLPDGSVSADWADGCHAEGGGWAVRRDDPMAAPSLQWSLSAPCAARGGSSWSGDLDLSEGWIGDGEDAWWPASAAPDAVVVDGRSDHLRLFGAATAELRVGAQFQLDLTLQPRRTTAATVDRVHLVEVRSEGRFTDLAVAELGGVDLDASDVLDDNDSVPVRLIWTPSSAGPHTLALHVDWREYGFPQFATVDVPLTLWVQVEPTR